jgi:hypothetical protein
MILDHSPQQTKDIMRATHDSLTAVFLGLAAVLTLGCGDSTGPAALTTGTIAVAVSTTSANTDIDPDGYTVSIDGVWDRAIGVNAAVTIAAFPSGKHVVSLYGLASNCSMTGPNPLSVDVIADKPASLASFSVSCSAQVDGGEGGWDY